MKFKICKTCRVSEIPTYSTLKNCPDCRARNRVKEQMKKKRKEVRDAQEAMVLAMDEDEIAESLFHSDGLVENASTARSSSPPSIVSQMVSSAKSRGNASKRVDKPLIFVSSSPPPVSRKSFGKVINGPSMEKGKGKEKEVPVKSKLLHELENEEKQAALKEIKSMIQRKVDANKKRHSPNDNNRMLQVCYIFPLLLYFIDDPFLG